MNSSLQGWNISVCRVTKLSAESTCLDQHNVGILLLYLRLSALGFTWVSFPHPHSNKRVVVNFPFVPDSRKTKPHFMFLIRKTWNSGRNIGIALHCVQINCICLVLLASLLFPFLIAKTLQTLKFVIQAAPQARPTLLWEQFWINFWFAKYLCLQTFV